MTKQSNLTSKGQVTIPKDVRDALGVRPGEAIEFDRNAAGEFVIRKPHPDREREIQRIMRQIEAVNRKFSHLREGRPTDEIMRDIRGDDPFPP